MTENTNAVLDALSAGDILSIQAGRPEALFRAGPESIKPVFRHLARQWHPDRNKHAQAKTVFAHICTLKAEAEKRADEGNWQEAGVFRASIKDGKSLRLKYLRENDFELGKAYIGAGKITYVVDAACADLAATFVDTARTLRFADDDMRAQLAPQLPRIVKTYTLADERRVIIADRSPDTVALKDVAAHFGGRVDARHVAWITSRLLSFACYLQWAGINHNGLSLDTCFINPAQHTLFVPGGWFYAAAQGGPLKGLPESNLPYAPAGATDNGRSDAALDRSMVRVIGRTLLGDPTGVRLALDPAVPKPLAGWLMHPGSGDAFDDIVLWQQKTLPESFGKRRFTVMPLHPGAVYGPTL